MRNRLNVVFHGKRTTARFPEYLWRLALIATGWSDYALIINVRSMLAHHDQDSLYRHHTASDFVREQLVTYIEEELTLAGFNPDSSRAHFNIKSLGK